MGKSFCVKRIQEGIRITQNEKKVDVKQPQKRKGTRFAFSRLQKRSHVSVGRVFCI